MTKFQLSTKWRRKRVDTSTGESRGTSGGALQGSSGAERSTPEWHSQDLAEVASRPGTRAPWLRANSPTA